VESQLADAFAMACGYGRVAVVEFLLDRGFEINAPLNLHGEGHTGLHVAAFHGHFEVVNLLLNRGARVDVIATTWPTPPLLWALTGWNLKNGTRRSRGS
jgi:ankyrin repeat protein